MCFGGSSTPPPPPPSQPIANAQPMEDMAPEIEIAGEDMSEDDLANKKKKLGTGQLNTDLGTGSISGAGLQIPN
tara:strand:+ start:135 stop:356 length:222 start_codon:yes stop_codon:yes gene_type:complete